MSGLVSVVVGYDGIRISLKRDEEPEPFYVDEFKDEAAAQLFALGAADEFDFRLDYSDERDPGGRRIVQPSLQICTKCREAKPVDEFGETFHVSRRTGQRVFHGWTEQCKACQEAAKKSTNKRSTR